MSMIRYGVQGSGKSHLLNELKKSLDAEDFSFFEGAELLRRFIPGDPKEFNLLPEAQKTHARRHAIEATSFNCSVSKTIGVVSGHYNFVDAKGHEDIVWTESDQKVFTHILYLYVDPEVIQKRRESDESRSRHQIPTKQLQHWQDLEMSGLCNICYANGIIFSVIRDPSTKALDENAVKEDTVHIQAKTILQVISTSEETNLAHVKADVDKIVEVGNPIGRKPETMLVLDGDGTLCSEDTGMMFWEKSGADNPKWPHRLKSIFGGPLGYTYHAFLQAMLLYQEFHPETYKKMCREVANQVVLHPQISKLLGRVKQERYAGAIVVTCGLKQVWEYVLERHRLPLKVVGGGRAADGYVVTAEVKAAVVDYLKQKYNMFVWAFGDSELDLEMMKVANQAIVVVGSEETRSKTMEKKLEAAIAGGLQVRQALCPDDTLPRLDLGRLPLIDIGHPALLEYIFRPLQRLQVRHPTSNAPKLLQTPMRDANICGPALREAHRRTGWYLAMEVVSDMLGTETHDVPHVQGDVSEGHRLRHEAKTTIVALMRGGEPMAAGVSDAFPLAMFVHANGPQDLSSHHLRNQRTVILVDSVINSGRTIVAFVHRIRQLHGSIHIVLLSGVVQRDAITGPLKLLDGQVGLKLATLRISDNKYTGKKATDTGNRLFNTTQFD